MSIDLCMLSCSVWSDHSNSVTGAPVLTFSREVFISLPGTPTRLMANDYKGRLCLGKKEMVTIQVPRP